MTLEDKELKIINNYGVLPQLKYFQSEVFELNEAIIKYENGIETIEHIIEEIADVEMMLGQFKEKYQILDDQVYGVKVFKADRQLERIGID